jgi:hypothetical protein
MKPIYVGLLMITAALGGGLLVKWQTSRPAPLQAVAAVDQVQTAEPAAAAEPAEPALPAPVVAEQAPAKAAPQRRSKPRPMPPAEPAARSERPERPEPVQIAQNVPPSPPVVAETPAPAAPAVAPEPPVQVAPPAAPAPPPPAPQVTLTAGTLITVRTIEALSTERNQGGDTFTATLDQPLVADGFVIAERGARLEGRIVSAQRAGRVTGLADLSLELVQLKTSDGQRVPIETQTFVKRGETSKGQDAAKIGTVAAIGAVIGAVAGGGKGAAIGAGAGGAAGAGTVMGTRGKAVVLPPETKISFRLRNSVTLTERQPARQY